MSAMWIGRAALPAAIAAALLVLSMATPEAARALEPAFLPWFGKVHGRIKHVIGRPRAIVAQGRERTVRIGFAMDADGSVSDVTVLTPSGSALWDRIAVSAVRSTSPFPAPPPSLVKRPGQRFALPIVYKP